MCQTSCMHSDSETTIKDLKDLLVEFRNERDWAQFHDPKNLAEAISIEAAELLELFLWKSSDASTQQLESNETFRKGVEEELADVFCFCLNFANATGIDVASVVANKIADNRIKYPIEKARGKATKYNGLYPRPSAQCSGRYIRTQWFHLLGRYTEA